MQRRPYPMCPYPRDVARPTCYRCYRPMSHCVCGFIKPFEAHTNFLILQHPHERRKYYSTTKLLSHALTNAQLLRGITFAPESIQTAAAGQQLYLLYPGKNSVDVEETPLDKTCTIIALDGTWIEARKILFRNPFLKTFPRVSFKRPLVSTYRIRKQPRVECLSTLESIAHLLKLNAAAYGMPEKLAQYDSLFQGFEQMNELLIRNWPRSQKSSSDQLQ